MMNSNRDTSAIREVLLRWIPVPVSLVVISIACISQPRADQSGPSAVRAASVLAAFEQIPRQIGDGVVWIDLGEVEIPTSQSNMLGLDAYFSRRFRRLRSDRDTVATVFLAHTPDIRYMTGHHPPQCYPASGWERLNGGISEFTVKHSSGFDIRAAVYRFKMPGPSKTILLTVVNGFLLPVVGSTARLEDARPLSSSGARSALGISQFQLLFEGEISNEEVTLFTDEIMGGLPEAVLHSLCSESGQMDQRKSGDGS